MRLRCGFLTAIIFVTSSPALFADEGNDKLDAILKEIKLLNQRVSELEQKVHLLIAGKPIQSVQANKQLLPPVPTHELIRLERFPDVNEVIRLQTESPGSLMKGIHQRERILRERHFPPEVFPQPTRVFPQP